MDELVIWFYLIVCNLCVITYETETFVYDFHIIIY